MCTSESVSDYRRVYQIESQPDTHYPLATYENPKRKRCLGNDDSPLATIAVHTYIHTYIHALHYIKTLHYIKLHQISLHTYIHTCIHTDIQTYTDIHAYNAYICALITLHKIKLLYITLNYMTLHTYIHTYIHTYMRT